MDNKKKITETYTDYNSTMFDKWVAEGWEWGRPVSHETYADAQKGKWEVVLTPTKAVPGQWFGDLRGKKVLGLASGGGQQMPIFAACGAICTVLDYSKQQLLSERMVADREGYAIDIVSADMTKPLPFADDTFDLIFHPVSNNYIEHVQPLWNECHRILKKGGRLLAGLDNGMNYLFDEDETKIVHALPYNPLKDPALLEAATEEDYGFQFSHTIEEQIGGQLRAGFTLRDLYEDTNGEGFLRDHGVPCFWATLAEK